MRPASLLARALGPSLVAFWLMLAIPAVVRATGVDVQTLSDGQVKAAFLYNFAKFVRWPTAIDGPLVIGIAGNDAFAEIFAQTVRGRSVHDARSICRRRSLLAMESGLAADYLVLIAAWVPARRPPASNPRWR